MSNSRKRREVAREPQALDTRDAVQTAPFQAAIDFFRLDGRKSEPAIPEASASDPASNTTIK